MSEEDINDAIIQLTGISKADLKLILGRFERKIIKKKAEVLTASDTAHEIYLILKGCMRLFYIKDGVDISAYFFTEGMFAGAYDSFISRQPSRHYIQALDECEVLAINYNRFQAMYADFPAMNELIRKVIEERFIDLHRLFTSHILDSPEERYLNLLKYRPGLVNRIPQHQLATFLGVTPVSLSRIRNRVVKK
jgi:CRP-like cAMP-binding protein